MRSQKRLVSRYGDIWLYANALPVGMSDWVFGIAKGDRGREMIAETVWFGAVGTL